LQKRTFVLFGPDMDERSVAPRSKGDRSRARVVERAYGVATRVGLEGLSIGELASELGVSKSGLFAHFGSKENLQLAVLDFAASDFRRRVFEPALQQPRGLPRLLAVFDAWLDWAAARERGGCIFLSCAAEYDDRDGLVRDALVAWFEALYRGLERTFALAIAEKHLAHDDPAQLVSEMHGIVLKFHLDARLLRRVGAREKARTAFARVLDGAKKKEPS
jgi:AcrR family transcriptional regulator